MVINIAETSLFTDLLWLKVSVSELCKSETESDTLSTGAVLLKCQRGLTLFQVTKIHMIFF